MKVMKLKDLEKTISGITEFVNEFKKSVLHKQADTVKFVHSKFPVEVEVQVEEYSSYNDDLYLNENGYKLLNGNKKLDITGYVHDLFEVLNCENEPAIIDIKYQYKKAHELITEFSETAGIEINHFYDAENKESELNIHMGESDHCSYTIKIKGQKIIVEDNTEEVRASKIETLNNLRKQIASLEYELGYDVEVEDEEEDEEEESDDDWDDED